MNNRWIQKHVSLKAKSRGFHLVTNEIVQQLPELRQVQVGLLHLFILHTSASLTINENADPDVRTDMETIFNRLVPENTPLVHTLEGPDDMPAHAKASMLGSGLLIPVGAGQLVLGTWQGVYLCEHRNQCGARRIVCTLQGQLETSPASAT